MIPELQAVQDHWAQIQLAVAISNAVARNRHAAEDGSERLDMAIRRAVLELKQPNPASLRAAMIGLRDFLFSIRRSIETLDPRCTAPGAQDGEDEILAELLPGPGTYLDLGASEPRELSNTWALHQRGWRGLLVEPLPWRIPALCLQRPGDLVAPWAVLDYDGHAMLRVAGSCSSVVPTWAIEEWGKVLVPCCTLPSLLARYPEAARARYVSLDVEGAEGLVLSCWPWDVLRPEVVSVEHVEYNPTSVGRDVSSEWEHHLLDHGYFEHARTRFNIIYRRDP